MGLMRVIFMGTPQFALPILEVVLQGYEVVGVYTRPDQPQGRGQRLSISPVKGMALERGLPIFQPLTLKDEEERLKQLSPHIIIVAAYGLLLPRQVLELPPFGCINIHPSLLPRHRGPSPVASAILSGDEITGVSLMLMAEGLDTGDILTQASLPISPQDTTASLTSKLSDLGAKLVRETLPRWIKGEIRPRKQDEAQATYSKLIKKEDGEIDWHLSAIEIWRRVRAFNPWPGCYTWWQGKLLKIIEASPLEEVAWQPGRVRAIGKGAGVETGKGVLGLKKVQLEGRKLLPIEDFLRGARGFIGSSLPSAHP
jgi:methionyl-tRNA formyltransferase